MTEIQWQESATALGRTFAERASAHEDEDRFVAENYAELKEQGLFSMAVPRTLGGGGASFEETCDVIVELGRHCASTALAFSMHTHLVAAAVWRFHRKQPGAEGLLRKVAGEGVVLVSTGATDWIDSNGSARRVEGGYRVSGRKVFASGCPAADLLITSIASEHEPEGPSVLHFPLSLRADGVRILDDWRTLGMRATGSHTVLLDEVFVPEAAIALKRPQGRWHPVWEVVLGVAPPLYMSAYLGLAEASAAAAFEHARDRVASAKGATTGSTASMLGELDNALLEARLAWRDMLRLTDDYRFQPSLDHASAQLARKTLVTNAVRRVVEASRELVGGRAFYRSLPFERYWRDVQAAHFHPLPERRQVEFSGRHRLGLDVVGV